MIIDETNAAIIMAYMLDGGRIESDGELYCFTPDGNVAHVMWTEDRREYLQVIPMTVASFLKICNKMHSDHIDKMACDLFVKQIRSRTR